MDEVKEKIKRTVSEYKRLFPEEYKAVVAQIAESRKNQKDQYASSSGEHMERALFEIPETLFVALKMNLSDEEMLTYKSIECSRWFAKTYKEFTLAEKI